MRVQTWFGLVAILAVACPAAAQTHVRVSVSPDGEPGNGDSFGPPALSADGRYVVFVSEASNLVANDTNDRADVFRYDFVTGDMALVSVGPGGELGDGASGTRDPGGARGPIAAIDVSADGNLVVFSSTASDFGGDIAGDPNVYLRDISAGTTRLISAHPDPRARSLGVNPSMSDDGSVIVFQSFQALHGIREEFHTIDEDIFAWTGGSALEWISSLDGVEADPGGHSTLPWISPDGSFVTYHTMSRGLADTGEPANYIVQERGGEMMVRNDLRELTMSADGSRWAYITSESLAPEDTDDAPDVYVEDRDSGAYYLASRDEIGGQLSQARISADGTHVVFYQDRGVDLNVFAYDIELDRLFHIDQRPGDFRASASWPAVSANGRRIAYQVSGNLIEDGASGQQIVVSELQYADLETSMEVEDQGSGVALVTVTLTNHGPAELFSYSFDLSIGSGTVVEQDTEPLVCTEDAGAVSCERVPVVPGEVALEPGQTDTFTFTVAYTMPGTETLMVEGTGSVVDTNAANDFDTADFEVPPAADLSVSLSTRDSISELTDELVVTVTNQGPNAVSSVVVEVTSPEGIFTDTASGSEFECGRLTDVLYGVLGDLPGWRERCVRDGPLAPGESVTLVLELRETVSEEGIERGGDRYTARVSSDRTDPVVDNNFATTSYRLQSDIGQSGCNSALPLPSAPGVYWPLLIGLFLLRRSRRR